MAVGPGDCPDLERLREHIGDCQRCPLARSRTTLVFGTGDPHARLMFIGEAPGKNEDLTGAPFVGAAGKLLDELLASVGIERSQVYIANMVKCRPPGNRDPEPIEIETCSPFLARQIELIDPVVIATLGRFSAHYVLQNDAPMSAMHGRLFRVGGRRVVPLFHPAAALYDGSKRVVLQEDFRKLRAVIDRVERGEDAEGLGRPVEQGPLAGHAGVEIDVEGRAAGAPAPPAAGAADDAESAGDPSGEQEALF